MLAGTSSPDEEEVEGEVYACFYLFPNLAAEGEYKNGREPLLDPARWLTMAVTNVKEARRQIIPYVDIATGIVPEEMNDWEREQVAAGKKPWIYFRDA